MTAPNPSESAGPARILFLDDEPDIVDAFGLALGMLGYVSFGFTNPVKALEAFAADPGSFQAVITDFTMPQMPCAEFIRRLRSYRADVPVYLCTGNPQHEVQEAAAGLAIRSVLYKPFDFQALEVFMGELSGNGP